MRTTLRIDDHLLRAAKRRARETDRTLGQIVEDALRRDLAREEPAERPPIPVMKGAGGPRPGLDLSSNRALLEALDEERSLDELR